MPFTQDGRIIKIDTPLGKDVLLLQGFTGHEGLSQVFSFDLELLSERDEDVSFPRIQGHRVTITIALPGFKERCLNGFIVAFEYGGRDSRFTYYRAKMVPWLWFLGQTASCRMFQEMSVTDIIAKVFQGLGFTDFRNATEATYAPREYCVQYRETALNFVSRLMEQYGIFYYFEHTEDKHTLVLADDPSVYQDCPGQKQVRYTQITGELEDEDSISDLSLHHEVRPTSMSLTDYNFESPTTDLFNSWTTGVWAGGREDLEIYDYPGEYLTNAAGEELSTIRTQEETSASMVWRGVSNCRAFVSGYKFTLTDHFRGWWNDALVLTAIQHTATVGGSYYGDRGEPENYSNTFTAIPAAPPFRPPRLTPRPVVQGPQTAVVAGKQGEEIWVDKYGRVKVQFHWDRESQADETSSCWIRVSQLWAGKNWGAMWIPRIGQEVIVDFLEGDPDQPIITGRVYNAVEMPPYELPGERTKSTIKSYSSKGGGGFNEIRFEDKKGSEQIFIHAQGRQDNRVRGSSYEFVGADRHLIVKKDQFEFVEGDQHLHTKGDQLQLVEGEQHRHVKEDQFELVDGVQHVHVKQDRKEKVDLSASLEVGTNQQQKVGMNHALDAGMAIHLKAGMTVVIEAGMQLTLKVGGNFVDINPAGVCIQGTLVTINSGGAPGVGAGSQPQAPQDAKDPKAPKEADSDKPGQADQPPPRRTPPSPAAQAMREAAQNGTPLCDT